MSFQGPDLHRAPGAGSDPSRDAVGKRPGTRRNSSDASAMRERMRRQKTVRHVIGCVGVGLHSGARVGLTLRPAEPASGIRFRRVDRPGAPTIPARLDQAGYHGDVTCLGTRPMPTVRMVEHLLAALAVCEIDNALVDISGPELPVMDGSALPFVLLIECAGTVEQSAPVAELEVLRTVSLCEGDAEARLEPADGLHLEVSGAAAAMPFSLRFSPESGRRELASARDAHGDGERFADEGLRHAALDALGDLALIPARLRARFVGANAGAGLRQRLLRRLLAEPDAWRLDGTAPPGPFLAAMDAAAADMPYARAGRG